jgi:hypothetical protein
MDNKMRTNELLEALAQAGRGIECCLSAEGYPQAIVRTLYCPEIHGLGETLFDAALEVAKQLTKHSNCPPKVKEALDTYDRNTELLTL